MAKYKRKIKKLEKQLDDIVLEDYNLSGDLTRVDYWKQILQDARERPGHYFPNVERSDRICELIARKDLDMEIPEELKDALESAVSMYSRLFEADRETLRKEIIEEKREIPANWDFSKVTERFKR